MATLEYKDFGGGDWGRLGPDKAAKNQFSAENMLLYKTGELGVRAGVRDFQPTSLAAGAILDMFTMPGKNREQVGFLQGTAVRYFQPVVDPAVSSASGSFSSSPTGFVHVWTRGGDNAYIATSNSGCYSLTGSTLTALTNSPNARAIVQRYDRLIVVPTASANTVHYTKGADFTNWTISAGNGGSITIGDSEGAISLHLQRDNVIIIKPFGGWWVLSGVPGVSEALRQVSSAPGPVAAMDSGSSQDGVIYSSSRRGLSPLIFDGALVRELSLHEMPNSSASVLPALSGGTVLFHDAADGEDFSRGLLFHNGIWTKHRFGVQWTTLGAATDQAWVDDPSDADDAAVHRTTCFTFADSETSNPTFFNWAVDLDRPGSETQPSLFLGAALERAGDGSDEQVTGTLELPYHTDPDGRELRVRRVSVHFRSWDTKGSLTNHIGLTVRSLREYEGTYTDSTALAWDEASALSDTAGTVRRTDFQFGDQGFGSAFQLRFSDLRGVALRRIVVEYDVQPRR